MHDYRNQRDRADHQVDLETMREMEEVVPMNLYEKKASIAGCIMEMTLKKIPGDTAIETAGCWIIFKHTDVIMDMNIR